MTNNGEKIYVFEILSPPDKYGESETIGFHVDYSKAAANLWLRNQKMMGDMPLGASIYRSKATDKINLQEVCI